MSVPPDQDMCGAKLRNKDKTCRHPKGYKTNHPGYGRCKYHGGIGSLAERGAEQERATAIAVAKLTRMGHPVTTDPQRALLELVWEAAGNVAFLRTEVQAMGANLVGNTYAIAQREGETLPIGEEVRAMVKLYGEWSDRLAKYSKMAIDAGIAERQVRLAEAQGYAIRDLIESVLNGISASPDQLEAGRRIAAGGLRLLAAEAGQSA